MLAANDELGEVIDKHSAVIVQGGSAGGVKGSLLDLSSPTQLVQPTQPAQTHNTVNLLCDQINTLGQYCGDKVSAGHVRPSVGQRTGSNLARVRSCRLLEECEGLFFELSFYFWDCRKRLQRCKINKFTILPKFGEGDAL